MSLLSSFSSPLILLVVFFLLVRQLISPFAEAFISWLDEACPLVDFSRRVMGIEFPEFLCVYNWFSVALTPEAQHD